MQATKTGLLVAVMAMLAIHGAVGGETLNLPAPYAPQQQVSGVIRIWGHGAYGKAQDFIETLTRNWETGFGTHQPAVTFDTRLSGTAAAIGALYAGAGDLALMGREIWPNEVAGFEEVFHYPPTGVDIVTGSFDVRNHGYAVVVFVHKDNPITGLTLTQLDAIFSADHRRGGSGAHRWGDLGLRGACRSRGALPSISRTRSSRAVANGTRICASSPTSQAPRAERPTVAR
jgi:phosphate transport system substrate-binding protein